MTFPVAARILEVEYAPFFLEYLKNMTDGKRPFFPSSRTETTGGLCRRTSKGSNE